MKSRIVMALCAVLVFSLSLALGQSKDDCAVKCTAAMKASCCMHGAKASLTSAAKNSSDAAMIPVKNTADIASASGKDGAVNGEKNSAGCTAAEKANCNMTKASTTGTKAGCCASKAKGAHAKNTIKSTKKSIEKVTEAKGTN